MGEVLISAMGWGLGHVTRDMPIVDELLRHGHKVTINAKGRALELMKKEYAQCDFIDFDCYPEFQPSNNLFVVGFLLNIPKLLKAIKTEHRALDFWLKQKKYDLIISDNRFGMYSRKVPSFFITHQLRVHSPFFSKFAARVSDWFMSKNIRNFCRVIIPDNHPGFGSLAGKLCISKNKNTIKKLYYAGLLASVNKKDVKQDIDYLITISGPGPQRAKLAKLMLSQVTKLDGKKVVLLGKPEDNKAFYLDKDTFVRSHAPREEMRELMNRAKFIISRSGYTTVMELAELEKKKGIFIPTPGQTEQVYLSDYYSRRGWFYSVNQDKLSLLRDVERAKKYKGFPVMPKTKDNAKKLYDDLFSKILGN